MSGNPNDNEDQKRTVRAGRRRPSSPSQPEDRQQAEAPRRRKPAGQDSFPQYSGGSGETGGSASPPGIPIHQVSIEESHYTRFEVIPRPNDFKPTFLYSLSQDGLR